MGKRKTIEEQRAELALKQRGLELRSACINARAELEAAIASLKRLDTAMAYERVWAARNILEDANGRGDTDRITDTSEES